MEITNKDVYEDPTVKLRKINKLARSLIDDVDTIPDYDTLIEIVRLSEEKKCYYCGSKIDLVDVKGYDVCMTCMKEGEK